ncbi:MAG: hypothetical protein RIT52_1708 [Pseudomonadota bacterium]
MTALKKYLRLEAPALWRDVPGARARDVVMGLREATVVFSDPRSEVPLTQWSLPAIERLTPGQMPARFAPGRDSGEEVELDDGEMIAALETVRRVLERRKPRPGRLRGIILSTTTAAIVATVVFWLPGKIKSYAASVLPAPTRSDLGDMALADLSRLTGQPCSSVPGRRAATKLAERLFPDAPPRIAVLPEGITAPAHLPGDILLLPAALVETADGPDVIAGMLLAESLRAKGHEPVDVLLAHIGLGATLRLLTTGTVPEDATQGFGETFLATEPEPAPALDALLAAFQKAQVSSASYGESIKGDPAFIQKNPYPLGAPQLVMSDEDWLEFQAICSE